MTDVDETRLLLADATSVSPDALTFISRDLLGAGTVTGFANGTEWTAYVDSSKLPVATETGLVSEDGIRIWMHPADPHLPALAPVAFAHAADVLLTRLGVTGSLAPEIVGYRAGRRAVLRVDNDAEPVWVKIVRPSRVERIVGLHNALAAAEVRMPALLGWSPDGLIVLHNAAGTVATQAPWQPDALLDAIDDLRTRIRTADITVQARAGIGDRVDWFLDALAPLGRDDQREKLRTLFVTALRTPPRASEVIHGDLHLAQLFLVGDQISALIDVDTAGLGDPAEDEAALIAHAWTSALMTPDPVAAERLKQLAKLAHQRWTDPRVSTLVAAQLVGHAVSSLHTGECDRANRLLDDALELLQK